MSKHAVYINLKLPILSWVFGRYLQLDSESAKYGHVNIEISLLESGSECVQIGL